MNVTFGIGWAQTARPANQTARHRIGVTSRSSQATRQHATVATAGHSDELVVEGRHRATGGRRIDRRVVATQL